MNFYEKPGKNRTKYVKRLLFILIISGAISFMVFPRYMLSDEVNNVTTLANEEEVFVFIKVLHYGEETNNFKLLWKSLTGNPVPLKILREDTIIMHYKDGLSPELTTINDFSVNGGVVWFDGALYCLKGPPPRMLWRWSEKIFEKLPDAEAAEIDRKMSGKFKYYSDQNKAEGWQQNTLADSFAGDEMDYRFDLAKNKIVLSIKRTGRGSDKTVTVNYNLNDSGEKELAQVNSAWYTVSKTHYFSQIGELTSRN